MLRLLKIEFQKLKSSRVFIGFIIAYFGILLSLSLLSALEFDLGFIKLDLASQGLFDYPINWHVNTWVASITKFLLAIILITSVVGEYQYGTLKQNLIDGLSKKEFIGSKVISIFMYAIVSCLFVAVVTLFLGTKGSGEGSVLNGIEYLGAYFLKLTSFLSLSLFFAVLLKRSAFAIFLLFVESIVESILFHSMDSLSRYTNYLPLNAMSNLIHEPISRMKAAGLVTGGMEFDYSIHTYTVIACAFYTVFFSLASYFLIKKRDL